MAYQTSCASYTSGRVGLSSATAVVADAAGREQTQHGSPLFPIACYAEDLSCFSVAWHWHEEFEFILAALGPIHVDVNKTRLTLQTGQGVFINSGALHAVEPAEGRALLHSGVFQPHDLQARGHPVRRHSPAHHRRNASAARGPGRKASGSAAENVPGGFSLPAPRSRGWQAFPLPACRAPRF